MTLREKHIATMTPTKGGTKPVYRLRWVFHFLDGKVRNGIWNGSGNRPEDKAEYINKTGLIRASIQVKDFYGNGIKDLFECDGHDYITAKWIGAVGAGSLLSKQKVNSFTLEPDIIGLSFITRKERVSVFVDGSISSRKHYKNETIDKLREHSK